MFQHVPTCGDNKSLCCCCLGLVTFNNIIEEYSYFTNPTSFRQLYITDFVNLHKVEKLDV